MNRVVSVFAAPASASCGTPALKYRTTSFTLVNEPLWKKKRASLSCRSVNTRNLKASLSRAVISRRPSSRKLGSFLADGIQGLERVVGEPEVVEVLFHELTDAGHVRVVDLLVEHRTAVAGVAAGAAVPRGREEELAPRRCAGVSAPLFAGQEPVPGRVPGDRGAQEGRRRAQDGDVVDQQVQVARRVGLGGLLGKRVAEQLPIGRELLQLGGLEVQHPVRVEQQERHAFLRRKAERVEAAGRVVGLAGEPAHQEAVVEGGADHAGALRATLSRASSRPVRSS